VLHCYARTIQCNDRNGSTATAGAGGTEKWAVEVGVSNITTWRARKKGWLKTVNIAGRVYLTQSAIDELSAVRGGEFAASISFRVGRPHEKLSPPPIWTPATGN